MPEIIAWNIMDDNRNYETYDCVDESKLPLSGGIMTGDIDRSTSVDGNTAPASAKNTDAIIFRDVNNNAIGHIRITQDTNNNIILRVYTIRNGQANAISLLIDEEGNPSYALTAPAAFRNALGASSGIFPVSVGGTGLSANPSALVDLSSENAASLFAASPRPGVTGVLSPAHGGTGVTTITELMEAVGPTFTTFSGTAVTAVNNTEYNNGTAIDSLTINWPLHKRGLIFGINFSSSSAFTGITHKYEGETVEPKLIGDAHTLKSKRYNLLCWYDGNRRWCMAKAA